MALVDSMEAAWVSRSFWRRVTISGWSAATFFDSPMSVLRLARKRGSSLVVLVRSLVSFGLPRSFQSP